MFFVKNRKNAVNFVSETQKLCEIGRFAETLEKEKIAKTVEIPTF